MMNHSPSAEADAELDRLYKNSAHKFKSMDELARAAVARSKENTRQFVIEDLMIESWVHMTIAFAMIHSQNVSTLRKQTRALHTVSRPD